MAFGLLGSLPSSSSTTVTGGHCWNNKNYVDHSYARYYATRCSWKKNGKSSMENNTIIKTSLDPRSTFDKYEKRPLINAVTTESYEPKPQAHNSKIIIESIIHGFDNFRKFSRFYAFMGLVAGSFFSSLLAVDNLSQLFPTFFNGYLQYIVPHFFMHLYIVGLNQLADLEIDKINKPYLPLAYGEFSFTNGVITVASFLFLSFGSAWMIGSKPSLWSLLVTFVLMTAYSINLPFLRWKKSTTLTVMAHAIGMTTSFNIAAFMHMKVSAHAIMALILWLRANSVDLSSNISLQSFYMFIFKLIYVENIVTLL
ncbi:hypothetical protein S83_026562, partial [Arachis hypogaea]